MPQAAAPTAESALAPDHIDATLNYIIDDGGKVFTIVASPGGTDTRSQRVRDILPDEAEELLQRRFAIIQVWRPIRHPVETYPLAMADAQTLSPQDMIVSERRAPGRIGQTYAIKYNPEHKWYWFPRMRRDEAYVFKVFDSMKDGRARWTAHTAFEDPTTPPHARPRESIEIRTMAFF